MVARRALDETRVEIDRLLAPRRAARFDDAALLRQLGATSLGELWNRLVERAPRNLGLTQADAATVAGAADAALNRRVDLLGSGPIDLGHPIRWSRDPLSGRDWETGYAPRLTYVYPDDESDVKLTWEISRLQWLLPLGQAYGLDGDERYASAARDIIDEWIDANAYAQTVNWAVTMEVALRAITLSWLLGALGQSDAWRDDTFRARFLRTLWLHGDYANRHLERSEVNGNHFTADAAGLAFVGLLFDERRWSDKGWRLLCGELPRQVTPDGVDFEMSASYHRFVLELFLLPLRYREQLGASVPAAYADRLMAMAQVTAVIVGPDGMAPLWGDADDARVLPLGLETPNDHSYLPHLFGIEVPARRSAAFSHGGVYVLASGSDHVFIDCGPVGLDGRGGHGHNDCLSFEASLKGTKLFTDSGSYVYTRSASLRNRFRATAAHNTPSVDGEEQNRIPDSLWQLSNDALPEPLAVEEFRFTGSHTGYLRLPDPVRPIRTIALNPELHTLLIHDCFEAVAPHEFEIPLHVSPPLAATRTSESSLVIGEFVLEWQGAWSCTIGTHWVSPSYGVKVEALRIAFRRAGEPMPLTVVVAPSSADREAVWSWVADVMKFGARVDSG